MSPVTRDTSGGRAYLDLQAKARQVGRPTDELLTTFVLERFLWRVSQSLYHERLVLKGGMLLAALGERRPTADVDMLALQIDNDVMSATTLIREVLEVACDDGVEFDLANIRANTIRDEAIYSGVRIVVPARVDRARHPLRIDLNVGDPVIPAPTLIMYPALLDEPFQIVGYPLETVLAEKLVTMLDRGELTTRERDFADVYLLTGRHEVSAKSLAAAILATATHRGSERRSLRLALGDLGSKRQRNWANYIERAGLRTTVPVDFNTAIEAILHFSENILIDALTDGVWNPVERDWQ